EVDGALPGLGFTSNETQTLDGVIGGGQTGYNYQFGSWVWGFELTCRPPARRAARSFRSSLAPRSPPIISSSGSAPRGRASASWRLLLLYGTGGVAYGQTKDTYTATTVGIPAAGAVATIKDVRAGRNGRGFRRRLERESRIPLYRPRQTGADRHVPPRRDRRELQHAGKG